MAYCSVAGIYIGNKNCSVSFFYSGDIHAVPNDIGEYHTPHYLAFTDDGVLVGKKAQEQLKVNPRNVIYEVPALLGRRFDHPRVQEMLKYGYWQFEVVNHDGRACYEVTVKGKRITLHPEEVLAIMLRKLKEWSTEKLTNQPLSEAVITVPTYFDPCQRQAVIDAAAIAGLKVRRLLTENLAAAIYNAEMTKPTRSFEDENEEEADGLILNTVHVDLNASLFNASVIRFADHRLENEIRVESTVTATKGVSHPTMAMVKGLAHRHVPASEREDPVKVMALVEECEEAIHKLAQGPLREVIVRGKDFPIGWLRAMLKWPAVTDSLCACMEGYSSVAGETVSQFIVMGGFSDYDQSKYNERTATSSVPELEDMQDSVGNKMFNHTGVQVSHQTKGAAKMAANLEGDEGAMMNCKVVDIASRGVGFKLSNELLIAMVDVIPPDSALPVKKVAKKAVDLSKGSSTIEVYAVGNERTAPGFTPLLLGTYKPEGLPKTGIVEVKVEAELDIDGLLIVSVMDSESKPYQVDVEKECLDPALVQKLAEKSY